MNRTKGDPASASDSGTGRRTLSELIIRYRPGVLIFWLVVSLLCVPLAMDVSNRLVVAGEVPGGEATAVRAQLADDFARDDERVLALVVTGGVAIDATHEFSENLAAELQARDWVSSVEVRPDDDSLILVRLTDSREDSDALASLKAASSEFRARAGPRFAAIDLYWTGEIAVREDIIRASTDDLRRSEIRALPISFLLLCFVFGTVIAAALPLGTGLVSILLTFAFAGTLARFMDISVMVPGVASLLGLALGIDYALLVLSQFRKELTDHNNSRSAAVATIEQCGKTVLVSGAAVAIGFGGLTLVPAENLRSIGIAGMGVAVFAALLSTTALPAVLSMLGERVELWRLWRRRPVDAGARWHRWAAFICDHPWRIAALSALPVIALALLARDLEATFPSDSWLPANAESIVGLSKLKTMGEAGAMNRLLVLYQLPDSVEPSRQTIGTAVRRLHIRIQQDSRTETVRSGATFGLDRGVINRAPESILETYLSADDRTALLEVTPVADLDTGGELTRFVRDIRSIDLEDLTGFGGRVLVGGTAAATADYEDLVDYWLPRVIALVALGSFVALAFAFRSVVIPFKAVALNLLSVCAAYGTIVLIFSHGFGAALFGLAGPVEGIFPPTPVIVFCAAFGISMDYEVFMLASIADARRAGLDDRGSIIQGVARTGRVITSAAMIMIVVFGAFAFGEVLPTQILGTALAVVVAVDALLIRMALGPAVIRLAGRWNWWPGRIA